VRLLGRGGAQGQIEYRGSRRFEIRHRGGREGGAVRLKILAPAKEGRRRGGVNICVIAQRKRGNLHDGAMDLSKAEHQIMSGVC